MWEVVRQGRVVRSRTYYILGSECRIFQNVAVQDLRHKSDHFMVVECLRGAYPRERSHYLGHSMRLPLHPPGHQTRTRADKLFTELWCAIPKLEKWEARHSLWISAETWILVDKRVSTRREPGRYQRILQQLGRDIRAMLKEDRQWQVATLV